MSIQDVQPILSTEPRGTERQPAEPDPRRENARLVRLKHGLHSKFTVLPGEDRQAYAEYRHEMIFCQQPTMTEESDMVEDIVQSRWHLKRVQRLEQGIYEAWAADHPNTEGEPDYVRQARCFQEDCRNGNGLDKLSRHRTRLSNIYTRASRRMDTLRDLDRKGLLRNYRRSYAKLQREEQGTRPNLVADPAPTAPEATVAAPPAPEPREKITPPAEAVTTAQRATLDATLATATPVADSPDNLSTNGSSDGRSSKNADYQGKVEAAQVPIPWAEQVEAWEAEDDRIRALVDGTPTAEAHPMPVGGDFAKPATVLGWPTVPLDDRREGNGEEHAAAVR